MSRGNRKGPIFDDVEDRRTFLDVLDQTVRRYDVRCYAFCLMDNHYHAALETPRGNLSDAMKYLNGVYTQSSNRRHVRTGHVFEGRFNSIVVGDQAYLRRLGRYIALNPVVVALRSSA
jgi:REP-associated tyrosine transposase